MPGARAYRNRRRLRSGIGKEGFALRAKKVERSFEHNLYRGGMRRTWLRGRENVQKRYLIQVAAYNLGLVMRALLGASTPKAAAARGGLLWLAASTADAGQIWTPICRLREFAHYGKTTEPDDTGHLRSSRQPSVAACRRPRSAALS